MAVRQQAFIELEAKRTYDLADRDRDLLRLEMENNHELALETLKAGSKAREETRRSRKISPAMELRSEWSTTDSE